MKLSARLQACASMKALIEQQSMIATNVSDLIRQHRDPADDDGIAEKICKMTGMAWS
jgi:hypothetical protein